MELIQHQQQYQLQQQTHFFEGVEKLLEIWFVDDDSPSSTTLIIEDDNNKKEMRDLRKIPRRVWETLLQAVKCEIISFSQNETVDAYVLSESSMFVSKRRWILKTCGTTTPLTCLKPLLQLASQIGFHEVCDVFYSRKNFSRPELQLFPHRGFCEESEFLDTIFEDGRSYCLGSINRECWYLYTLSHPERGCTVKHAPFIEQQQQQQQQHKQQQQQQQRPSRYMKSLNEPDQTIEVLMQNLDPNIMNIFNKRNSTDAKQATIRSGIHNILPDMEIDDFLFDPCGYSMNGINDRGEYMTIHITPERQFSYVSFESNVALDNYAELIDRVIQTFLPLKFIVTIFANKSSEAYATVRKLECKNLLQWQRTDMQCCNFPSYNLLFAQYTANVNQLQQQQQHHEQQQQQQQQQQQKQQRLH